MRVGEKEGTGLLTRQCDWSSSPGTGGLGCKQLSYEFISHLIVVKYWGGKIDIPPQQKLVTSMVLCARAQESSPRVSVVVASPEFRNVGQKRTTKKQSKGHPLFLVDKFTGVLFFCRFYGAATSGADALGTPPPVLVWFTVINGANLFQSGFSGFCPAAMVFQKSVQG